MLFKKKEEQITNSSQIKEILDKSNISIKDEMNIMSYIYKLEEKLKHVNEYVNENNLRKGIVFKEEDNQWKLVLTDKFVMGLSDIIDEEVK